MPTWSSTASRPSRLRRTCRPTPTSRRRPRPRSSPPARTATRWSIPTARARSASSTSPTPRRRRPAASSRSTASRPRSRSPARKLLAGVNTSESKAKPSGNLTVIDLASRAIEKTCDLGGQPDFVAVSKDGAFAAVAIENERDEELNDGEIPQLPAGNLKIVPLAAGVPDCDGIKTVDLTGIAAVAPEDPEPEFVAFNGTNEIAVTLQENNHIAIVDAATGKIVAHFSAGSVTLDKVDTKKDGSDRLRRQGRGRAARARRREVARRRPLRRRQ